MKRFAIAVLLVVAMIGSGTAQQRFNIGGAIIDPSGVTAMDMFNYSQHSYTFGTARSAAMAGAMTSLGGDMSSLMINPAGLGMYRTNEVILTPMIGVAHSTNVDPSYESNTSTRFSMSNFGMMFKAYEGTGKILAVNCHKRLSKSIGRQIDTALVPHTDQPLDFGFSAFLFFNQKFHCILCFDSRIYILK